MELYNLDIEFMSAEVAPEIYDQDSLIDPILDESLMRPLLDEQEVVEIFDNMADKLDEILVSDKKIVIFAVLNGGLYTAEELAKRVKGPSREVEIRYVRLVNPGAGQQLGKKLNARIIDSFTPINEETEQALVVEDIIDSGLTLRRMRQDPNYPKGATVAAFLNKLDREEGYEDEDADVYGHVLEGLPFVVGVGLDYNQWFRLLRALYEVVDPERLAAMQNEEGRFYQELTEAEEVQERVAS